MEAYQDRVVEEKRALDEKLVALVKFNESKEFMAVRPEAKRLLLTQVHFMQRYSDILGARIELFNAPAKVETPAEVPVVKE